MLVGWEENRSRQEMASKEIMAVIPNLHILNVVIIGIILNSIMFISLYYTTLE